MRIIKKTSATIGTLTLSKWTLLLEMRRIDRNRFFLNKHFFFVISFMRVVSFFCILFNWSIFPKRWEIQLSQLSTQFSFI